MPEMLEIEEYRLAADPVIGRTISAVHAPDEWYAKGATTPTPFEPSFRVCASPAPGGSAS